MSDLTGFLLARIAEDVAAASLATPGPWWGNDQGWEDANGEPIIQAPYHPIDATSQDVEHVAKWNPARVLAECEAKRRIVEAHPDGHEPGEAVPFCSTCEPEGPWNPATHRYQCPTLRLLALPYADHPDYREEWRP